MVTFRIWWWRSIHRNSQHSSVAINPRAPAWIHRLLDSERWKMGNFSLICSKKSSDFRVLWQLEANQAGFLCGLSIFRVVYHKFMLDAHWNGIYRTKIDQSWHVDCSAGTNSALGAQDQIQKMMGIFLAERRFVHLKPILADSTEQFVRVYVQKSWITCFWAEILPLRFETR